MITFKTMEHLTFKEAHELFTNGFEGYFIPLKTILIEKALDLLNQQKVNIAKLEALSINQPAIKLYEKVGYIVVDTLYFLDAEETK